MIRFSSAVSKVAGVPRSKDYPKLNKIADSMAGFTRIDLENGIKRFRNRTEVMEVARHLDKKNITAAVNTIEWDRLPKDLAPVKDSITEGVVRGAKESIKSFPMVIRPQIAFDQTNPRIKDFLDTHIGTLIREIGDEARIGIRAMVTEAFDNGVGPLDLARQIRGTVGLTEHQALAVERYRVKLLAQGVKPDRAERQMLTYANKLTTYRANNIARTESIRAVNFGQLEVWNQAAEDGIIDTKEVRKVWVIDPVTVCEICEAIQDANPDGVKLGEVFQSPLGEENPDAPPAHPSCFPAGSPVITREGELPIEQVVSGMEVLTHKGKWKRISHTIERRWTGELVGIEVGSKVIEATPEHPFLVGEDWVQACKLEAGQSLMQLVEQSQCLESVMITGIVSRLTSQMVYNLEVLEDHSYICHGVATHNCNCGMTLEGL